MKRILSLGVLLVICLQSYAQFSYTLGVPLSTTGWTLNAPNTYVNIDSLVLNDTVTNNLTGYIHTDDSSCLTSCSQFLAKFDFQIKDHGPNGPGEGMAFWYIQTPPSVSPAPTVMGFPVNARGFALVFDTHDNDGIPTNPIISLRRLNGMGGGYNEGLTNNVIGAEAPNKTAIVDTQWHHCEVSYYLGQFNVSLDGVPIILGTMVNPDNVFDFCGRFGFSSQTSALNYSKHSIKNVEITGYEVALPVVAPAATGYTFCQDTSVPNVILYDTLSIAGDSIIWYDKNLTQLSGPPAIPLNVIMCDTFYVAAYHASCGGAISPMDTVVACVQAKPTTPSIGYDDTYCQGETVIFNPVAPPGFLYYWYDVPTGGIPTTTSPVISTAVPDTIIWYLALVSQQLGCEGDRVAYPFYILESPQPVFDTTILFGCAGDTVIFNNTTVTGDSCVWIYGDGATDTADSRTHPNWSPTHIYYSQDRFSVRLIVYNRGTGCVDSVDYILNNQHPLQALFKQNADTLCQGAEVRFTDTSIHPVIGNFTYFWDFGDGDTTYTKDPVHIYDHPGVYTVMHVITDNIPCSDTIYRDFYIDSSGVMAFVLNDTSICEGDLVTFTGDFTDIGLRNYYWDFGDGIRIPNVNPVSHSYDVSGIFNVTLHGNYRICPIDDSVKEITVHAYPTIDLGPDTTICPNTAGVILADNINQFDSRATWLWSTGDSTAAITARHQGIYTAKVTIEGCSSSDSVQVFKDCYIDIPNVFTPNADGSNDYFLPRQFLSKNVSKFNMQIFNRWGEVVFKTDKIDGRGWDGKFNSKDQPVGTYVYLIEVEFGNGTKEHYQGNVTLLR